MPATLSDVRTYYDRNTTLFLRFGSSPEKRTIHRSLWPEGTQSLEDALAVSNNLVLKAVRDLDLRDPRLLDLGCGVGATLFHVLAGLEQGFGVGVTLSAVQASLAVSTRKSLSAANTAFLQGDFHRIPLAGPFDLIYSIEALIHSQEPRRYLQEVVRLLIPGGRLILLDDFYKPTADKHAQAWLKAYKEGWYVPNMQTRDELTASARDLGLTLIETRELTPELRLRALSNPLAQLILYLGKKLPQTHPIVPSMLGSMALQQCLKAGWIEYRWMVFEKN